MSLVVHKYTPAEIGEQELEATFAARGHTVDFLLKALRDQIAAGTLSSFVILGPRGAGKSTVIRMVELRIKQDAELRAAWLPVAFPEEQFEVASLRDLLAATLKALAAQSVPAAGEWSDKVESEADDEQSLQLGITGLRTIARALKQRFILFIENLNQLLEECFSDKEKGTLRRLLMSDPFLMIVGSAVHVFDSLKRYDEAFFNYFTPVRLARLDAEQVLDLLKRRATFDDNRQFLAALPEFQARIRAIVQLSGGNPRLVLMLYELLSQRHVVSVVEQLRQLVDELTPLLKDEVEQLPPQQRKIVHALMEQGGTAQPSALVGPTRLQLGTLTQQLRRLKEAQFVDLLGGGKGRRASYTVPDQLFVIWYQMRYLRKNRRRIELFVEVLKVWFEAEERLATLRSFSAAGKDASPKALRDCAWAAEYFAASLAGTAHESVAHDLAVQQWLRAGDYREAAAAHTELTRSGMVAEGGEATAYVGLSMWCGDHQDPQAAIEAADLAIKANPSDKRMLLAAFLSRAAAKTQIGDLVGAIADCTEVIKSERAETPEVAVGMLCRGMAKGLIGDAEGAITDFTTLVGLPGAGPQRIAGALLKRAVVREQIGDVKEATADYSAVIDLPDAPAEEVAWALINRGIARAEAGDVEGAIADYAAIVRLSGALPEQIARALVNRGMAKEQTGDTVGALADYATVIDSTTAPAKQVAHALLCRGIVRVRAGDFPGAVADFSTVIDLPSVADEQLIKARMLRAMAEASVERAKEAKADYRAVAESAPADDLSPVIGVAYLVRQLGVEGGKSHTNEILATFAQWLGKAPESNRSRHLVTLLSSLAAPETRAVWLFVWHHLAPLQLEALREALAPFEGVAQVLEDGDIGVLDPLPPEQREFALTVLKKFKPQPV